MTSDLTPLPSFYFLMVAAALFSIGLGVIVTKRNAVAVLIGIELILNAVNLNLVTFSRHDPSLRGQLFALFVIVVAAAEAAIALAIVLKTYQYFRTADLDQVSDLKN